MGIWHYQVVIKDGQYSICEYYPADNTFKAAWTEGNLAAIGETKDELINDLGNMLADAKKYGVRDSVSGEIIEE